MLKKIIFFLFFFLIILTANAHVAHYKDLKRLEFDLYRNNKLIGEHVYLFTKNNDNLVVYSKINFKIKKLGITLYKYHAEGTEVYKNSKLDAIGALLLALIGNACCCLQSVGIFTNITKENTPP